MTAQIRPGPAPAGTLAAPPSKSMAHRAVLCAALADGESRLANLAHSQDIDATLGAAAAGQAEIVRAFGAGETLYTYVDLGEGGQPLCPIC